MFGSAKKFYIILLVIFLCVIICYSNGDRNKRALVFPMGTVCQVTFAVTTPALIPDRNVFLNMGLQANYMLITNATTYHTLLTTPIIEGRSNHDRFPRDLSSNALYDNMASALVDIGLNGKECILKTICQLAESPLAREEDDILGEIMHFVLTPSGHEPFREENDLSSSEDQYNTVNSEYLEAEHRGLSGGDCVLAYTGCPESIIDEFTEIFSD